MNRRGTREHFVYWLFDSSGRCLYVGTTRQPEQRWQSHRYNKPEMAALVANRRMAGPFDLETARRLEREQQEDLLPVYDGQRWLKRNPDGDGTGFALALRLEGLEALRGQFNIRSDRELADRIGINPSNLSRLLSGKAAVGTRFAAGALGLFGTESFSDLFEIVPDGTEAVA